MNSLLDCLMQQDGSRPAVVTPTDSLTLGDVLVRVRRWRDRGWLAGTLAVANGGDVASFLETLIGCDGWVETLHLQPAGVYFPADALACSIRPLPKGQHTQLVLTTSGTTGTPKFITHTLASLTATTKVNPNGFSDHRWGLLYDPARFAGLQVVLQALLDGATLVVPGEGGLDRAVDFMIAQGVTALSATPSYWRQLLMARSVTSLPLKQITLGGEIADARILQSLRTRFPKCRIVHIYASTETGVGFSVRDGRPGFPQAYLDSGALNGVRLRITEDGHLLLMKTQFEHRAADVCSLPGQNEGFVDTGDLVEIRGDRVHFLGRASGLINVGGNKVCPETVEAVLCSHPDVVAARVFGKTSSFLGSIVAADVQVRDSPERGCITAQLNELCKAQLASYQRPAIIKIVERLEISGSGKISRGEAGHG